MADAYEGLAEKTELSYEEALALKEVIRKRNEIREPVETRKPNETRKVDDPLPDLIRWRVTTRLSNVQAVDFLNEPPRTRPDEAVVTSRPDGKVDIYFIGSGW
jgi:hypothetical protein